MSEKINTIEITVTGHNLSMCKALLVLILRLVNNKVTIEELTQEGLTKKTILSTLSTNESYDVTNDDKWEKEIETHVTRHNNVESNKIEWGDRRF